MHTDTGIMGLGETVDKVPGARGALHGTVAPLLLGQDPLDIEGVWRFVMDNIMYHGYAGAETRALSALEVALWDIMGKHYSAPLYHLLGGRTRTKCRPTTPVSATARVQDYAAWHDDDGAGELARSLLADGIGDENLALRPLQRGSHGQYIGPPMWRQACCRHADPRRRRRRDGDRHRVPFPLEPRQHRTDRPRPRTV